VVGKVLLASCPRVCKDLHIAHDWRAAVNTRYEIFEAIAITIGVAIAMVSMAVLVAIGYQS